MPRVWQVQEAKARFSEMLESTASEGPQVVTKRGVEAAVLISVDEWRRLERLARTPGTAHRQPTILDSDEIFSTATPARIEN